MKKLLLTLVFAVGCGSEVPSKQTTESAEQGPGQCVCENGACFDDISGDPCCICQAEYECLVSLPSRQPYCGKYEQCTTNPGPATCERM